MESPSPSSPSSPGRCGRRRLGDETGVIKNPGRTEPRGIRAQADAAPYHLPVTGIALAASIMGACRWGRAVSPREMRPVDLVVWA